MKIEKTRTIVYLLPKTRSRLESEAKKQGLNLSTLLQLKLQIDEDVA